MQSNDHSNCPMKFSILAELMHAEIPNPPAEVSVGRASPRAEARRRQRLAGTLAPPCLRCILSVCVVVTLLAFGCSKKSGETPAPTVEKKEESRVTHGTNGETIIKLDAETQKLMGLQTAALASAQLNPEIKAYGRVLDATPLASLVADLTAATATAQASQAELERLKTLASQNNASARLLQAAEAA